MIRQNPPLKIINNRYVLQEIIQTGGMTTVYKGRDLSSDDPVAIKRFDRDLNLPKIEREAFDREVEALKNLSHPGIVRIFDSGEDDEGKLFVILELMDHDLLQEKEREGQAFEGWDDFTEKVILPLLDALTYAHEKAIAHRDVKPANILVALDGTLKLADFGISKLKHTLQPRVTLSQFMSPPFSPPESDTGSYTYARDIYSMGVLFLWGMSEVVLRNHSDVNQALNTFNAHPDIVDIVRKSVALQPEARQQSAAVMAAEIERVHAKRRHFWAEQERSKCILRSTKRAVDAIRDEIDLGSEREIIKFVREDINSDSCIQRFIEKPGTIDEHIRPYNYAVLGSTFRYHITVDNKGGEGFALVNVTRPENYYFQRDRQNSAPSPLTFEFERSAGIISMSAAISLIEKVLENFEANRKEEERRNRETALFDTWIRVLDAKMVYEREQSRPIHFVWSTADNPFVTLQTKEEAEGVELGEWRIIDCGEQKWIRGEVWELRPGEVILNCSGSPLSNLPQVGVARLDQWASRVAVDRQREAVDRIRGGNATNGSLKPLILDPSHADPPTVDITLDKDIKKILDVSKQNALIKALGCKDILIVEGPPGTGKTRFIAALVNEELRRNPKAHILIASQTHIAIDNALEIITEYNNSVKILRVASTRSDGVSDLSTQYLVDQQLRTWRKEVFGRAATGLERWASSMNLDLLDIRIGTIIRQIANTYERIVIYREKIKEEESRKSELEKNQNEEYQIEYTIDIDRASADLNEYRSQLDIDKKELEKLKQEIIKIRPDAKELLKLSPKEQWEWADALVGSSEEGQLAKRLINIQGEWFDRFGTARGFLKPLIERSSVVAATCVGFAAMEELSEFDFDLCVIDEASKATAMESAVPMASAKRWVLVGDSKQLLPFQEEVLARPELRERFEIDSFEAIESMFGRFQRLLPDDNKVRLTEQYRMVVPISTLISECFYDSELHGGRATIDPYLCALTGRAVNWLSTSRLAGRSEQKVGNSFINAEEAVRICDLLSTIDNLLVKCKVGNKKQVLVLSGYEAQLKYLNNRIKQILRNMRVLEIECCTVDRVQGRETDIVLFSVTRSNMENKVGFLRALERINVALSRARELLYIIGDSNFVQRAENAEPLQRVLDYVLKRPNDCHFTELID